MKLQRMLEFCLFIFSFTAKVCLCGYLYFVLLYIVCLNFVCNVYTI